MFWTFDKLSSRMKELLYFPYRYKIAIPSFLSQLDPAGANGQRPPKDGEWREMKLGDRWKGRDIYIWLKAEIQIPADWSGKKIVGLFQFGETSEGNTSGYEALLYINGEPYQGIDTNHREVFLPDHVVGQRVLLEFRIWSGMGGGGRPKESEHQLVQAELAWLDEATDDLYFTSKAMLETIKLLPEVNPERQMLLQALDRAYRYIDWSKPNTELFYNSIKEASASLHKELSKFDKHHHVHIRCIGHTHIDLAWLWQLKHTREKAARSFSTVLRLMEMYPEYIFLQTQPQLYEDLKRDYPKLYEQIRERIREGRWEAGGAMWVEADCNLISGESLVRQLLFGIRFFEEEFGVSCNYLWLPDVFGYSWAMPQILKQCGIETFMTTKISWNQYNRMPHDTFKWRGIDGTEILAHFITTSESGKENRWYTYSGEPKPSMALGIWEAYRDKDLTNELLLCYGYGDGGGGVNREMLEMRRRLEKLPGLPQMTTGRADEYFASLQKRVANTDQYVHTWDGELYLEYHRGTYTSHAYNKKMNRKMELLYRESEMLSVLSSLQRSSWDEYDQKSLNEGWKIVLRNQFHDIIPGSSIREVYEDSWKEYALAESIGLKVRKAASEAILSKQDAHAYTVFNCYSKPRTDFVFLPEDSDPKVWRDSKGMLLPAQRSNGGWLVEVQSVLSMGYETIHGLYPRLDAVQEARDDSPFQWNENGLESPLYILEWNDCGQLTRIYDKRLQRDVLANQARGNVFQIFEDRPMMFDAWDIDLYYQEKMREVTELRSIQLVECGPLRAIIEFDWVYMDSSIQQRLIVYANKPRIDFDTYVDWKERKQLMKVAFPVDIRATEATYDIQFGNVKRPTHWNTSWDYAKFETVGHQWADLSEHGYGVSLLNDCKYGYDIKDNIMRLTLIKSATWPDNQADKCEHRFTYAILPHGGSWLEAGTVDEAWALNNPFTYEQGEALNKSLSLFQISGHPYVSIAAVKKAEDNDSVILRLHEYAGARGTLEITSDWDLQSWQECDLLERPIAMAEGKSMSSRIQFQIKPYEIKSFLVRFQEGTPPSANSL
ncbi:alpha-mannosidase [Paenibacillus roseipurpureus]|uniref:Alpha-mannosidase n=1 Tax=Paenibacillus roseopurpureus TaxID=2918901 RepID=A0AA96LRI6_9BACL|nr:alpha-mannosidase [Paenibacillus sp. MBLB1832]WNR45251.1 alpha-mannosidase [Paenibacillus sp. MBLB1832]